MGKTDNACIGGIASLGRRLRGLPSWQIGLIILGATALIGIADYRTGTEISLAVAYLAPIMLAVWFMGPVAAFGVSALCVAAWITGDAANGMSYSSLWVPVINGSARLASYGLLIVTVARVKYLHQNLELLADERAVSLAQVISERQKAERAMLDISEREQRRIGQDLHDSLCQHLTGVALASHALMERLEGRNDIEAIRARRIANLVEDGIRLARNLAKGLHPVEMRADGLMHALEEFCSNTSELFNVHCRFECQVPVMIHDPAVAGHLFRIAQEAVSNAIRHGRATDIKILLEDDDPGIRLAILDNGTGLPEKIPSHDGMGLRIMADRAKMLGACFSFAPGEYCGTSINFIVPHTAMLLGGVDG